MRHGRDHRDQEVPEPERGIEPRTFSLPWRHSATELHGRALHPVPGAGLEPTQRHPKYRVLPLNDPGSLRAA